MFSSLQRKPKLIGMFLGFLCLSKMAASLVRLACASATRTILSRNTSLLATNNVAVLQKYSLLSVQGSQLTLCRQYSNQDDEYEKLWAAATGGRGTGRGRKKKVQKGVAPEKLKYGRGEMKWEGFNAPVVLEGDKETKEKDEKEYEGFEKGRTSWFSRGWSGRTWPGRKTGHPERPDKEILRDFDSVVVEVTRVSNVTSGGKKRSQRALVVVGNRNGAAGFGIGKGRTPFSAIRKARNTAANYLYFVERCDNHTIFHDLESQYKKTRVIFQRKPSGYGLRCHRAIKEIAELLGIEDMRCKVLGPTTPLSLVHAVFQGLISQETHQELADRTGRNVVEFRQELGNRPLVVASPSNKAAKQSLKKRVEMEDYDFNQIFDPHKGLHRPKHKSELF